MQKDRLDKLDTQYFDKSTNQSVSIIEIKRFETEFKNLEE